MLYLLEVNQNPFLGIMLSSTEACYYFYNFRFVMFDINSKIIGTDKKQGKNR